MPYRRPPAGITPPAPGLEREEPIFVPEDDIPTEGRAVASPGRDDERPQRSSERE